MWDKSERVTYRETYIDNDHLDIADDEYSVFVGLRDVDVTVGDSDSSSPAAVDSFGPANVVLLYGRHTNNNNNNNKHKRITYTESLFALPICIGYIYIYTPACCVCLFHIYL